MKKLLLGLAAAAMLAGCAEKPGGAITTTVAAASGESACADLTSTHLLFLVQAQMYVVANGSHATDNSGWIKQLQDDISTSPTALADPLRTVLATVQSLQDANTIPGSNGVTGAVQSIRTWCGSHGYPIPASAP